MHFVPLRVGAAGLRVTSTIMLQDYSTASKIRMVSSCFSVALVLKKGSQLQWILCTSHCSNCLTGWLSHMTLPKGADRNLPLYAPQSTPLETHMRENKSVLWHSWAAIYDAGSTTAWKKVVCVPSHRFIMLANLKVCWNKDNLNTF